MSKGRANIARVVYFSLRDGPKRFWRGGEIISKLKILISVEFFYIMYLFSGAFKESLNIPFDIAGLFLGMTIVLVSWRLVQKPHFSKVVVTPVIFMFTLLFIVLLSALVNDLSGATIEKMIKLIALTMPAFLLPLFFVDGKDSVKRVLLSISILAVLLSLFSLRMIFDNVGLFIGFNEGNYLGLARITGIGFIALSFFFLISNKKNKVLILPLLLLVSFTLISTGSRMPLLAIALIVIYALLQSFVISKGDILIKKSSILGLLLASGFLFFISFLYARGYFETTFYRFQVLFEGGGGNSVFARLDRIEASIQMFSDNYILGGGFGNLANYYTGTSGLYSHNLFFEFLSELGIMGILWLISFLVFMIYQLLSIYKKKHYSFDGVQFTLIAGFLFFFFNAMVSGDINDNRAVFAFASLLFTLPFAYVKSKENMIKGSMGLKKFRNSGA
ncbi:O-antigen ligase family protein [Halalkalibacter alkalisediminis]|uniref:O-antigen ligase family protein n=1 Tax=Halalkalibacter alkalisediminis TaxID=935616 RepID=A0ABV6NJA3_9BACI|nr:O-antigen ligase family protein [Halalkalibacter alkalisediminis]